MSVPKEWEESIRPNYIDPDELPFDPEDNMEGDGNFQPSKIEAIVVLGGIAAILIFFGFELFSHMLKS